MNDRTTDRDRDQDAEQREREAFVLLVHVLNVTEARVDREVLESRLARDLVFESQRVEELVELLTTLGYLRRSFPGAVRLAPLGLEYLQRAARARQSVRRPQPPRVLRSRG